jgi:hypothetical protein
VFQAKGPKARAGLVARRQQETRWQKGGRKNLEMMSEKKKKSELNVRMK